VVGPGVGAVDRQQRVVEVEEREMHRRDFTHPAQAPDCAHSRTSGTVMARLAAMA
jgi:hypothetical protein